MSTASRPAKKPAPAPVRTQNTPAKKPAPPAVKPQTRAKTTPPSRPPPPAAKKPVPRPPPAQKPAPATKAVAKPPTKAPPQVQKPQAVEKGPKSDNWISRTVQSYVQMAGDYAGGYVNGIGDKVNNVGEGIGNTITNQTRYWGQGVSGYGNDLKDAVGVGGPRVATAGNPLGIAGQGQGKGSAPGAKAEKGVRNAGKGSASNPLGI